jgi:hypothetical protein
MAALFTGLPKFAFAQKQESLDAEIGFYYKNGGNDYGNGALYAQVLYTWWFNKYIGCSAGAMVLKGHQLTSNFSGSWTDGDKFYSFNNPILHVNAVGEFRVAVPLVWKFGLALNARFMFSPMPLDKISAQMYQGGLVKDKSTYIYTKFNLNGIINAGLYFDFRRNNIGARISLGYGIGSYDVYNTFRHATIDGHSLTEHIPTSSRYIHNVFLSLTIF